MTAAGRSAPREMGLTAAAQSRGKVACNKWAPWPARYRAGEMSHGVGAPSLPIRRETVWPTTADHVQFQPTAGFNVLGIAPD